MELTSVETMKKLKELSVIPAFAVDSAMNVQVAFLTAVLLEVIDQLEKLKKANQ